MVFADDANCQNKPLAFRVLLRYDFYIYIESIRKTILDYLVSLRSKTIPVFLSVSRLHYIDLDLDP